MQEAHRMNLTMLVPCFESAKGNVLGRNLTNIDLRDKPVVLGSLLDDKNLYAKRGKNKVISKRMKRHRKACWVFTFNHSGIPLEDRSMLNHVSVYAGHFRWKNVDYLAPRPTVVDNAIAGMFNRRVAKAVFAKPAVSCIMLVREPISRFASCYRERLENKVETPLVELSSSKLLHIISAEASIDGGCANEIPRWVAPYDTFDALPNQGLLPESALEIARGRMAQCIILNLVDDCARSEAVAKHWFPWIQHDMCVRTDTVHVAKKKDVNHDRNMKAATLKVLHEANRQEHELYEFAMARAELQWKEFARQQPSESQKLEDFQTAKAAKVGMGGKKRKKRRRIKAVGRNAKASWSNASTT